MLEGRAGSVELDLQVLRAGICLMALHALGDADAADEVAQESLARAVDAINCPGRTANLGAYVAGIARHVIADHFRARARLVSIESLESAAAGSLCDTAPDALSALCSEGEIERVRRALERLPAGDRDLVRLCYYEGLSPAQVATRMGVPPETIRQRKLRALQRLREAFDKVIPLRHDAPPAPTVRAGLIQAEGLGGTT
jgi:RNA polymerase sigma factor (sigma-70 family)